LCELCELGILQPTDDDVNLYASSGGTRTTTIALSSEQIRLNAPNSYTNNLVVTDSINGNNGLNIGFKLPLELVL